MATITTETTAILNQTRGEAVRDAFVSALEKIVAEGLPDADASDSGKILAVNSSGKWAPLSIERTLSSIAVTTNPTKTTYTQGETLDLTGIAVTASYTADLVSTTTADVTSSCTFSPADGATLSAVGTQAVTVSYTEGGRTKTTTFNVTVAAAPAGATLSSIAVTTRPTKLNYAVGETLNLTGMVITATFSDSSTSTLSYNTSGVSCSPAHGATLGSSGTQSVSVSYTYEGVIKTASFNVAVAAATASLAITSPPNKTTYSSATGYAFDSTGLVVSFTDTNNNTSNVTSQCSLDVEEGEILTIPDGESSMTYPVTATYVTGGQTYTASFNVTVNA